MSTHLRTGRTGEEIACQYLQCIGYVVIDRNVRMGKDEIDIVAFDPHAAVIVCVEVKARAKISADFSPDMNLTSQKIAYMHRAAERWCSEHGRTEYRIDSITVAAGQIVEHRKGHS